jgi:hypothetical protein
VGRECEMDEMSTDGRGCDWRESMKAKVLINEEKDQYDLNPGELRLIFPSVLRCEYGR